MGQKRPGECEKHGSTFLTEAAVASMKKPRKPIPRVSEKRQAEIDAGERPRSGSTLKPGRGFAVAPAQRAKVKLLACLGCGRDVYDDPNWTIDPAHLVHRSDGGCDSKLCVLPLCRHLWIPREGCHPSFDRGELDLHPRLAGGGYEKELAHAIEIHGLTPLELVRRVTGEEYAPAAPFIREVEELTARVAELEAAVTA